MFLSCYTLNKCWDFILVTSGKSWPRTQAIMITGSMTTGEEMVVPVLMRAWVRGKKFEGMSFLNMKIFQNCTQCTCLSSKT